jgi:putative redox protein
MSAEPMDVTLRRLSGAAFEVRSAGGQTMVLAGPPSVGGAGEGMRPMEALLSALASCSAVDVLMILQQQREPLADLEIFVHGERADAVPAVFTAIHLHFAAGGAVLPGKLTRAVRLSMEKYCSVAAMLGAGGVRITHGVSRILAVASAPAGVRVRITDDRAHLATALAGLGVEPGDEPAIWLVAERGGAVVAALRADATEVVGDVSDRAVSEALAEAARAELPPR